MGKYNGEYLGIQWMIRSDLFCFYLYSTFEIPSDICKSKLQFVGKSPQYYYALHDDDHFIYVKANTKTELDEIKEEIKKIIDEIIDSSYNVGGTNFLESQRNIEMLLNN